jgi:sulfite reductase (NADPH) hemoprotein beta-component
LAHEDRVAQVAEKFPEIEFRLTANQNVILANVPDARRAELTAARRRTASRTTSRPRCLHAAAMACPALPTCGLALAESERMLPALLDRIENALRRGRPGGEEIIIR